MTTLDHHPMNTTCDSDHPYAALVHWLNENCDRVRREKAILEKLARGLPASQKRVLEKEFDTLRRQKRRLEPNLLALVDANLRAELKGFLVYKLGLQSESKDVGKRYTELVNEFFVRILENGPDGFWRLTSLQALREYASVALTNVFRGHHRKGKRESEVVAILYELRRDHFERNNADLPFEQMLAEIKHWEESGDADLQRQAQVLRDHYISGLSYPELADQLSISEHHVRQLKARAIANLRRRMTG